LDVPRRQAGPRLVLPLERLHGRAAIVIGALTLVSALLVAPVPTYVSWARLLCG